MRWTVDEAPRPPTSSTPSVSAVTNAFGDPTRREIYLFVRDAGAAGVTAGEVAEHFELHPNVARHHLEKLTGGGYLVVEIAQRAGRRHRARRRPPVEALPRRSARRHARAPAQARRPARRAARRARSTRSGPTQAEALADEVGFEYGRDARRAHGPHRGPPLGAAPRSARSPTRSPRTGSPRTPRRTAAGSTIVSECCPFGETAQQYPHVVCALDRGMIRGMLAGLYGETSPQFETSRPDGDDHCVARV